MAQAFAAVAQKKESILGTVRVTAYEHMEVADQTGDQSKVDMLLFPAGMSIPASSHFSHGFVCKIISTALTMTLRGIADDKVCLTLLDKEVYIWTRSRYAYNCKGKYCWLQHQ